MFKFLSPINYVKRIIAIRKDIEGKKHFISIIPRLESDAFFSRYMKVFRKDRVYLGINLLPEIKLQKTNPLDLENEEKRRLAMEISKFNDVFAKYGILEMVKLLPKRIESDAHYGFVIEIFYNYRHLNLKSVSYIFFYSLFVLGFIAFAAFLGIELFL